MEENPQEMLGVKLELIKKKKKRYFLQELGIYLITSMDLRDNLNRDNSFKKLYLKFSLQNFQISIHSMENCDLSFQLNFKLNIVFCSLYSSG